MVWLPFHWFLLISADSLHVWQSWSPIHPCLKIQHMTEGRSHCSLVFWKILIPLWNLIFRLLFFFLISSALLALKTHDFHYIQFNLTFTIQTILWEVCILAGSKVRGDKKLSFIIIVITAIYWILLCVKFYTNHFAYNSSINA